MRKHNRKLPRIKQQVAHRYIRRFGGQIIDTHAPNFWDCLLYDRHGKPKARITDVVPENTHIHNPELIAQIMQIAGWDSATITVLKGDTS